jgi:TonB-linked SusC/RagA family outer membrane protein
MLLPLSLLGMALLAGAAKLQAQDAAVAGIVLEGKSLRPVAGAQVVVEDQNRGTLTDVNGRFRITGLTGTQGTLRVVMIGYREHSQPVRIGDANVRVTLHEAAVSLDELVVTGTAGGQQKRAIGNSVAQIRAADIVATAPVKSAQDLLNGRAAGVVVMPGTGQVGSGSRLRIRGISTLSLSSDPLIYIDGIRVNNENGTGFAVQAFGSGVISRINDFNPDDIESIEILKGPAAATLYGTEAARGVINIITKKGAPGGTRYSFTIKQGANWFMDPQGRMPTNFCGGVAGAGCGVTAAAGEIRSINLIESEDARGTPVFRTGAVRSYAATMSGGSENVRYYVSGDVDDEEGAERNNALERFSGRANLQVVASTRVDLSANVGWVKSSTNTSCEAGCGGAMWGATFGHPGLAGIACGPTSPYGCGFSRGFQSWSPEGYYAFSDNQDIDRFTGSVQMNWRPFKWFSNRLTAGTDVTDEQNEELLPFQTKDTMIYFWGATAKGYKAQSRRHQTFNTFDYSGTATFDLSSGFNSATSVGMQYYQRHIEFIYAQGNDFAAPGLSVVLATSRAPIAQDDFLDNNTLGMFVQQQFSWRDRLFVTGAVRVDNNSAFGSDFDWVTYPKASLSWVLNEEPFFQSNAPSFINTFKLRLAYGHSGNQPTSFSALRTYAPVTGPNNTPAVTPNTLGNPNLGPEKGSEIEIGFDAGFLGDRVGAEFTYYNTKTKEAILLKPIAPSSGFSGNQFVNAGEIANSGVELQLRGQVLDRRNLGWNLSLNVAHNHNEITDLDGLAFIQGVGRTRHVVGHPVGAFYLQQMVSADYNPTTNTVSNQMCASPDGPPVPCFNAAGANVAPFVELGRPTPSVEGSLTSTLRIMRRVRLTAMVDYKGGHHKFNNNARARCAIFTICRINVAPQEFTPLEVAATRAGVSIQGLFVEKADFAKLREVSLGYDVPEAYVSRIGARALTINLAMRNIHTWTNYSGIDPENLFLSGTTGFIEQSNLPQLAQFVTSVNISF